MSIAIITGSGGLIGSAATRYFSKKGLTVVGIDNDMRKQFFGDEASTAWCVSNLKKDIPTYTHILADIRDSQTINLVFKKYANDITVVLHTAAQPSHDWAAKSPETDFTVNALGTLVLLEATRAYCPEAPFIFTSTNKVYGDRVNSFTYEEKDTRFELVPNNSFAEHGIDESMSVDQCLHSVFGASKVAADILVQEYGRYFGMRTAIFRGGCLTGSGHSATQLHGFLGYVMRSALTKTPYTIFGYKGKQVRDNIHAHDLISAFWNFVQKPRCGEVYNIGGSRFSNISVLEAIEKCEQLTKHKMSVTFINESRIGDHQWWISDVRKFQNHYPDWKYTYTIDHTLEEIYAGMKKRYC